MLQVLAAQHILSAPVVACTEGDTPDDCTDVIGFVDIRDVLVSFLAGNRAPLRDYCVEEFQYPSTLTIHVL